MTEAIGRYRIDRRLGSGAFASVWLGYDDVLDAPVAIKVLADNWSDELDVRNRFIEEARILRRADSHRLVRVYDIGDLPDGRPYFVMTYADRGTLRDRIPDEGLPVGEALRLTVEIAKGAAVLHKLGIIHRDIKPSNVLFQSVAGGERLLIADLGIAKAVAGASGFTLAAGSPGYMAPEQSLMAGGIDIRADVHALGAVAYHLLTGEIPPPPWDRRSPSEVQRSVPTAVDAVVMRAMEPDRELRWPTAEAFTEAVADLRHIPDEEMGFPAEVTTQLHFTEPVTVEQPPRPPIGPPMGSPPTQAPKRRRGRGLRILAAILSAVAVASVGLVAAVYADLLDISDLTGSGYTRVYNDDRSLSVEVPAAWARQVQGANWVPRKSGLDDGKERAALAVAGDLASWRDPRSPDPGVFIGRTVGDDLADFTKHPGCSLTKEGRQIKNGQVTQTRHECGHAVYHEIEFVGSKKLYVQIKQNSHNRDEVDRILNSINAAR